jgi:hypothetical protein
LLKSPALVNLLSNAADPSGQFPVYDQAPQYLRESLVFPYAAGMQFQQAVVEKMGTAGFAEVFRRPPSSTREILHPELYLAPSPELLRKIEAPEVAAGRDWKLLAEGMVGEFDHQVLLKLYAREAMPLAAEWRGGQYRLYEHRRTKRIALSYATRWSSAAAAGQYLAAYRRVLAGKWSDLQLEAESPDALRGTGGGGAFQTMVVGDTVISREGLPEGTLKP